MSSCNPQSIGRERDVVSTADPRRIFGNTEDNSGDMDNIFDSAENTLVNAEY